jgi:30S ribosomal protein S31
MGKGDKKSKKGKIFKGSYGVSRPRKTDVAIIVPNKKKVAPETQAVAKKAAPEKKTTTKKKTVAKK